MDGRELFVRDKLVRACQNNVILRLEPKNLDVLVPEIIRFFASLRMTNQGLR